MRLSPQYYQLIKQFVLRVKNEQRPVLLRNSDRNFFVCGARREQFVTLTFPRLPVANFTVLTDIISDHIRFEDDGSVFIDGYKQSPEFSLPGFWRDLIDSEDYYKNYPVIDTVKPKEFLQALKPAKYLELGSSFILVETLAPSLRVFRKNIDIRYSRGAMAMTSQINDARIDWYIAAAVKSDGTVYRLSDASYYHHTEELDNTQKKAVPNLDVIKRFALPLIRNRTLDKPMYRHIVFHNTDKLRVYVLSLSAYIKLEMEAMPIELMEPVAVVVTSKDKKLEILNVDQVRFNDTRYRNTSIVARQWHNLVKLDNRLKSLPAVQAVNAKSVLTSLRAFDFVSLGDVYFNASDLIPCLRSFGAATVKLRYKKNAKNSPLIVSGDVKGVRVNYILMPLADAQSPMKTLAI